ncbi:MAG: hypothetical protein ACRDST_23775 [Pseudonocardiaceae bacterium]
MLQGLPPPHRPMAFADESFREDPTKGFYVLAAAVLEVRAQQPARELMRRLLGSRGGRQSCTGTRWIGFSRRTPPTASLTSTASTSLPSALRCPAVARNEHVQHA